MKYEVGDKVKIVAKKNGDNWNTEGYMDEWLSKTMTIVRVYYDHYSMEEDNGVWAWYEEMIECKAEEKEESRIEDALRRVKEMRKFDCADVIGEIYRNGEFDCSGLECGECIINLLHYLSEEEPVQLSHDEYVILKNIDEEFTWIARDDNGELHLFTIKPHKDFYCKFGWWGSRSDNSLNFSVYEHLFQFVKWEDEEPYEISKLLEDYEKEHKSHD